MAERLYLSPATVKWYTRQIYGKLGIHEPGQKRRQVVVRRDPRPGRGGRRVSAKEFMSVPAFE
jgi:hypothetical protein